MKIWFDEKANEVYNEAGIVGFWKGVIPALIMVSFTNHLIDIFSSLLSITNSATLHCYSAAMPLFGKIFHYAVAL